MEVIKNCFCKYLKTGNGPCCYWLFSYSPRDNKSICCSNNTPSNFDMAFISHERNANEKATEIINQFGLHDWSAPTTLMLGRYQPWHEGHHALYKEAGKRTDQVLLGVRNTYNTSEKDPLKFDQVKEYIAKDDFMDGALVLRLPNITNIVYGRDVGYKIEQVDLGADIHAISATQKRKEMGI